MLQMTSPNVISNTDFTRDPEVSNFSYHFLKLIELTSNNFQITLSMTDPVSNTII